MPQSNLETPILAPPGAGVPIPQRLAMRFVLKPFVAMRTPWEVSNDRFAKVTAKIEKQLEGLNEAQLSKRVLIAPATGLEDSSRYWSIAMTLDHLAIVGRQISKLICELDAGRVPAGEANTAAVKPSPERSVGESLHDFREFSALEIPGLLSKIQNRGSKTEFRHPWFGLMRHQGWFWLLPTHQRLHLKQIEEIRREL